MVNISNSNGNTDGSCHIPRSPQPDEGNAEAGKGGRRNNVDLVETNPELLHFGADFIRLCIRRGENYECKSIDFLRSIFSLSHNDTNAASYNNLIWGDTDEEVSITFGKTIRGEACYVRWNNYLVLCVEKLDTENGFYKKTHCKYEFVFSLYGEFFALTKLGFDADAFMHLFYADIARNNVIHIVSRLDICYDISGQTVLDIANGITVHSPSHAKVFSYINTNWKTGIPETFYYGKPTDKNWHARAYNKVIDTEVKGKEALYPQYWGLETVTRLELELKNDVCKSFGINFLNCFEEEFLFAICESLLNTKYVEWKILPFLKKELKAKGIGFFAVQRAIPDYNKMPKMKFYKNTVRKNVACINRMQIPLDEYFARLRNDVKREISNSNQGDAHS